MRAEGGKPPTLPESDMRLASGGSSERRGGPGNVCQGRGPDQTVRRDGVWVQWGQPKEQDPCSRPEFLTFFLPMATLCQQVYISEGTWRAWCPHKSPHEQGALCRSQWKVLPLLMDWTGSVHPTLPLSFHFVPFYHIPSHQYSLRTFYVFSSGQWYL